ncbi:MAG: dTMP kinase, partial [Pseudomonas sp.]
MNRQNGRKGVFIVLEGTDGSGKGTQFKHLTDKLVAEGHEVALFDFPQYGQPSSYFAAKYLNGEYGSAEQVGPYTGSLFYALDRYDAAAAISDALADGKVVLANRFTASNMAHQGTKFDNAEERRGYFIWLDNLEFDMLRIPRPDLNLVLRVPAETAQKLVDQKSKRSYTDKKRDMHEADLQHLSRAVEVYDDLCQLFPKDFYRIDCVRDGQLMEIEAISKLVSQKVSPLLPRPAYAAGDAPQPVTSRPTVIQTEPAEAAASGSEATKTTIRPATSDANPYIIKDDRGAHLTDEGKAFLEQAVTDPTGPVYGFTDSFGPVTIAAAMARL